MFPFTFKLPVPGLSNPFSAPHQSDQKDPRAPDPCDTLSPPPRKVVITRRRPSPSLAPPAPLSRKRGWEPSFPEPSPSATTRAAPNGYLDTPAKYRAMAATSDEQFEEMERMASELPPNKRRRTLAGSIVSTALSAALIGTAVGLTVYRLWRDRGKEQERLPPPPYQQGEWVPEPPKQPAPEPQPVQIAPAPRGRKPRPTSINSKRSSHHYHRRLPARPHAHAHAHTPPARSASPAAVAPEFDFSHLEEEPAVEDQMDWIGDKLSALIEEGKKALGREVVVMSDAQEDEVDDGTGAWEEDDAGPSKPSLSRSSSVRRRRPISTQLPPSYAHRHDVAPLAPLAGSGSAAVSVPRHQRRMSAEAFVTPSTSFREDERAWESAELRESMERARARFLKNRGT